MTGSDSDEEAAALVLLVLLDDELEVSKRPRLSLACLPAFPKLESDWARIYRNGDSRSFVKLMMIDRPSFDKLLAAAVQQAVRFLRNGRTSAQAQADPGCSSDAQQEDDT